MKPNKRTNKKKFMIQNLKLTTRMDVYLLIVIVILVAFGLIMVLSASSPSALAESGDSYTYFIKQLFASILGLIAMVVLSFINYENYKKVYKLAYFLGILILFLVLIPKIGVEVNGAKRWINLGIQIQPSELTKIGMIIFIAGYYSDPKIKKEGYFKSFVLPIILTLVPVFILLKVQNHLSAGVVISSIVGIMIIMSSCKQKYIWGTIGVIAAGIGMIIPFFKDKIINGFRADRIAAWLDPWADPTGISYQTIQGLYAIGSGGLFGVGLGESKQKYLYIPEAHNDFIFAIIAEELGFIGCALVLGLFAILIVRGMLISINSKDTFGSLVAVGITMMIAVQVIFNIAVVTNTFPNTGISLPFLSYGGSSIAILLSAMGILLNISKTAKKI